MADEFVVVDGLDFQDGRGVAVDPDGNAVVYWYQFFGGYSARGHSPDGQQGPVFDIDPYAPAASSGKPFEARGVDVGRFALLRELGGEAIELHVHALDGTGQSSFPVVEVADPANDWLGMPSMARLGPDVYAAAWTKVEGPFLGGADVFYRLFNLAGDTGPVIQLNTIGTGEQSYPAIDAYTDGTLAAVWRSDGSVGTDDDGLSIQARLVSPGGELGAVFQVNTTEGGDQRSVDVAFADGGSFLVVWRGLAAPEDPWSHVWSQAFGIDGTPIGTETRLSAERTGYQIAPQVVAYEGGFVVVWSLYGQEVLGRVVGADGVPVGEVFRIDNLVPWPGAPAVAPVGGGGFVVSWPRYGNTGGPVSARRFKSVLFRDGFESGDLTAWSQSLP